MDAEVKASLDFQGYTLEDSADKIPDIKGVYCAYACTKNAKSNMWELQDIVYFGKSEEGDSSIRTRVIAHKSKDDNARSTLTKDEKLAYAYAKTDKPDVCEKALVAAHENLPRLANDRLTRGYKGPSVKLTITGKAYGMKKQIHFDRAE